MKPLCVILCVWLAAAATAHPQTSGTVSLHDPASLMPAQPGENVILPVLRAVVLLPVAPEGNTPSSTVAGLNASRVPLLATRDFEQNIVPFLGHAVSVASLGRLEQVVRVYLQLVGRPFARVYTPPQEITDGTVRIVVQLASLDGPVRVEGNKWFAAGRYTGALRARAGGVLDAAALNADLAWLNRNPFRRVTPVIEAGEQPGTTRITLKAEEQLPLTLTAGYDNTGTKATKEDRVSAAVQWGNACGRGDLFDYRFAADPTAKHLRGHSLGYTAFLPWRHVLTLQAALSEIDSVVPAPFAQSGKSWQVGARYEIPLAAPRPPWTQSLSFSADFKYSDNTLEFATIPITGNVTHIAQVGASYGLGFPALGGRNDVRLELAASPGGLTRDNRDPAFAGSRPGAKAEYAYAKLGLRHQRALGNWSLFFSADTQFASGALLGTEQLNGGGAAAVRGYRESSAFGDWGVVGSAELHGPTCSLIKGRDRVDAFAFLDAASLRLCVDRDGTDLASAGLGVNYQFGRRFSLRASYGWQLKQLAGAGGGSGHGHVSASILF